MVRGFAVLPLLVALGACSSDGRPGAAPPPATSSAPASPSASPPAAVSPTATPSTVVASAYVSEARFKLPSGNVGCVASRRGVSCDVSGWTWTPPPKPASCDGDWGGGISLDRDGTSIKCATDTLLNDGYPVLAYGASLQVGAFRCASARDGVRCAQVGTRNGFLLSRSRYEMRAPAVAAAGSPPRTVPAKYVAQVSFASPTRNLRCVMLIGAFAGCDIGRVTFTPPPRPADCPSGTWPGAIVLGERGGYFGCGEAFLDVESDATELPYGDTLSFAEFRCTSRADGVECVRPGTRHRFLISTTRYQLG